MSRYTASQLENDINATNLELAASGSNMFFSIGGAYGYTELWKGFVTEEGVRDVCVRLETGSPRECQIYMQREAARLHGKVAGPTLSSTLKPTRQMALGIMQGFVDMTTTDFHAIRSDVVNALTTWAPKTGYRKPADASGSLGRYFYENLQKLAMRATKTA